MAEIIEERTPERTSAPVRGLASLATALGVGAVTAAAACCVLPLAFASIGISAGLASILANLASIRMSLLVVSTLAVIFAWVMWWRKQETACAPDEACAAEAKSGRSAALLVASTLLVCLAAIWSVIEPALMKWVS
jgi:mercuric ion transport protein